MTLKSWRARFAAALLAALPITVPAAPGVDYSDLWWNPLESGWGVGIQRQGEVIFLTLFVYGPDGAGSWFVAPDVRLTDFSGGPPMWQGILYRARGPGFATAYDAASVEATAAGWATLQFTDAQRGVLRYAVDGVEVSKPITRMTWREPSPEGRYRGGFSAEVPACVDPNRVGPYEFVGAMNVSRAAGRVIAQITTSRAGLASDCTFDGVESHGGRLASWTGTFSCNIYIGVEYDRDNRQFTTRSGAFRVDRLSTGEAGIFGTLTAQDQDCAFTGHFGGVREP